MDKYRWTWRQIENVIAGSLYESLSVGTSEFIKKKYGPKNAGDLSHYHRTCIRQALCPVQFAETWAANLVKSESRGQPKNERVQ